MAEAITRWYSPQNPPFALSGFAFYEQDKIYRRLQINPPAPIPPSVEGLSWSTAGGQIRFRASLCRLKIKVKLRGPGNMYHMAGTGQCGFDCYASENGVPRFYGTTTFSYSAESYEAELMNFTEPRTLEIILNFPLYIGVYEVLIGLDTDAIPEAPMPYVNDGRVVIYGTSITQGGCASRPGMAYTNILSRWLNTECINMGFSGSGRGEPEMALALREVPRTSLFVIDIEANTVDHEWLFDKLPAFVDLYREARPTTPILVLSKIPYAKELLLADMRQDRLRKKSFQQKFVEERNQKGDLNIHFYDGELLFDDMFEEYTVDGVHPTDLGFFMMAKGLFPVIRMPLSGNNNNSVS